MKKRIFYLKKIVFMAVAAVIAVQSGMRAAEVGPPRNLPATEFGYNTEIIRLTVMLINPAFSLSISGAGRLPKEQRDMMMQELKQTVQAKSSQFYDRAIPREIKDVMARVGVKPSEQSPHVSLAYVNVPITPELRGKLGAVGDPADEVARKLRNKISGRLNGYFKRTFSITLDYFEGNQLLAVTGGVSSPHKSLVAQYSFPRNRGEETTLRQLYDKTREFIIDTCGGNVWLGIDPLTPHVTLVQFDNAHLGAFFPVLHRMGGSQPQPYTIKKEREDDTRWLSVSAHAGMDTKGLPLPCQRAMGGRVADVPDVRPPALAEYLPPVRPTGLGGGVSAPPRTRYVDADVQKVVNALGDKLDQFKGEDFNTVLFLIEKLNNREEPTMAELDKWKRALDLIALRGDITYNLYLDYPLIWETVRDKIRADIQRLDPSFDG